MEKIIIILLFSHALFFACSEDEQHGQYPTDHIPPGKVEVVQVENTEGGAVISYIAPDVEDFLYLKANYVLDDGTPMEVKASTYTNKLVIEGIGKSRELEVKLISVDRSRNESEPLTITVYPLNAPIYSILNSMTVQDDFGGIRLTWKNPKKVPIIVEVLSPDEENKLVVIEKFYSESQTTRENVRGYDPMERQFSVCIKDRWGNVSDTLTGKYHPYFEAEIDKANFRRWNPPGLPYNAYTTSNWWIENLWNKSITSGHATYVLYFTFDMGKVVKLSRFKVNQRPETNLCYALGHPKRFELYGSTHPNVTGDPATWQFLGYFESIKPSGLPLGQVSNEDIQYAHVKGEDWDVDINAPNVRYIWFRCLETWGMAQQIQVMEMTLWGDPTVPQE
ncbi:MAG: DUF5000 domain-containing lipoprotein [Mangrovibacterium sp.]